MTGKPTEKRAHRNSRLLIGVGVVALLTVMIVLHLTGVFGAGSH
jgi:predicted nucleic acid-binding Zn ribbon protein